MTITMYPTLQAFYEENREGRLHSPEAGYGNQLASRRLPPHLESVLRRAHGRDLRRPKVPHVA